MHQELMKNIRWATVKPALFYAFRNKNMFKVDLK